MPKQPPKKQPVRGYVRKTGGLTRAQKVAQPAPPRPKLPPKVGIPAGSADEAYWTEMARLAKLGA